MNQVFNITTDGKSSIRISGPIGASWWDDSGTSASQFVAALDAIPRGSKVDLYVNSEGGSIKDGLEIYNAIKARAADVTAIITGYAVSIAGVIPLAAGKVVSPRGSVWMIHKPWTMQQGNADDMRKAADMLDKHEAALVAIYADETGQSKERIASDLAAETWMTGEEAVAYGLADELSDDPVALAGLDGSRYRRMPLAMGTTRNQKKGDHMNDDTITAPNAGTNTPAPAATEPKPADTLDGAKIMAELHAVKEQLAKERKANHERIVDSAIADGRVTASQKGYLLNNLDRDEAGTLAYIASLPVNRGLEPLRPTITGGKDAVESYHEIKTPKGRFAFAVSNWSDVRSAERRRGGVYGANTHSGLSTITGTMIADGVTTVLQNRCAALSACARDFGTNAMIPRQPVIFKQVQAGGTAQSNATNFEDTTNFVGTIEPLTITPAQLTAGGHITNAELNSGLRMSDWVEVKGAEMADKIMAAVAAIITTGNFTATPLTAAAASFGGSDMKTLWGQLKKAVRKSIILDGEYYAMLLPATREQYNVEEGGSWPGWNGVFLNTVWTGATTNTVGFALDPARAIAVAAGVPAVPESAGRAGLATNTFTVPGIELSVQSNSWFALAGRVDWMTFDVVFGAAKNDGTAGVLIKSA